MLLSERKNKRYIIVIDQYDDNLGRYIPKSHTVEAPTLVEAIINCEHFRQTSMATHPGYLLSVLNLKDCIRDTITLLDTIPGIDDIDCSLSDDCDYVMIEPCSRALGDLYLSHGTDTRHLTYNRDADGIDGLAALICGIRDMLRPIV